MTWNSKLKTIGEYAFKGCQNIESIILPNSIENIEQGAFCETGIKEIVIPASVSKMATRQTSVFGTSGYVSALFGAKELRKVRFSDGMGTIPAGALSKCDQIATAILPSTATSIGEYAFFGCTGLSAAHYSGTPEQWAKVSIGSNNDCLTNCVIFDSGSSKSQTICGTLEDTIITTVINGSTSWIGGAIIGGKTYNLSRDSKYQSAISSYKGKKVVCTIQNDEIVWIKSVADIKISISCSVESTSVTYSGKKYSSNTVDVWVKISNTLQEPDFIGDPAVLAGIPEFELIIPNAELKVDNKDIFSFNGKQTYSTPLNTVGLGQSKVFCVTANVKNKKPDNLPEIKIGVNCTFDITQGDRSFQKVAYGKFKIINEGIKEPTQENVTNSSDKEFMDALANAAQELKKATTAFTLEADISNSLGQIFTDKQLDFTAQIILCVAAMKGAPEETFSEELERKVIEKVFSINTRWLRLFNDKIVVTVAMKTQKYGVVQVEYTYNRQQAVLNDNPYAFYGDVEYKIIKSDKPLPNSVRRSGATGGIYMADMSAFCKAAYSVAESELKRSYNKAWGKDANKAADIIFGTSVNKILSKTDYKSFSGLAWAIMTAPAKKVEIKCPVDVYVYDKDNKLVASVEDNNVTLSNPNVDITVNGDTKTIMIYDESYRIEYRSAAEGTMDIVISEFGGYDQPLETTTFEKVPLKIGVSYTQNMDDTYMDESEYSLTSNEKNTILPTEIKADLHAHTSSSEWKIGREATHTEYGWKYNYCDECHEWYEAIIPKLTISSKLSVKSPSTTTVSYGFTLNLHANVTDLPEGARVVWSMDGSGFELSPSADGMTCGVKSVSKGSATITAKVVDKNGNAVKDANGNEITASQQLTSKAGFFQKLVAFFKKLFGSNMIIPSSLNKLIK